MTRSIDTIIPTGIKHTAAAHVVAYGHPITIVWSTLPVACIDWLGGDMISQVRWPADQVPTITEVQCETCGSMVSPKAIMRGGHITGDKLTDLASEVAKLADEEREYQRGKLIASLVRDAKDMACQLFNGDLTRDEVSNLDSMTESRVTLRGDEVVAWSFFPNPNGEGDPEIIEVARPIPTTTFSTWAVSRLRSD